jgi:hypothetical protein
LKTKDLPSLHALMEQATQLTRQKRMQSQYGLICPRHNTFLAAAQREALRQETPLQLLVALRVAEQLAVAQLEGALLVEIPGVAPMPPQQWYP